MIGIKNKRINGFTLVEVIISLAIFAIASLFIMQMFVQSNSMTDESSISDEALQRGTNIAERMKTSTSYDRFLNNLYIDTGYELPEMKQVQYGISYTFNYDENWFLTDEENCKIKLILTISSKNAESGELYQLTINYNIITNKEIKTMVNIHTSKYYPLPFSEVK